MLCRDAMRPGIEWFHEMDTTQEVAQRMRDTGLEFAPVCDSARRPVGMLSARDLALRVCAENLTPAATIAREVMRQDVPICREDEDLDRAEELMSERDETRVLVVDSEGRLEGLLSYSDLAAMRMADREVWA